jgi:hypothetical protein
MHKVRNTMKQMNSRKGTLKFIVWSLNLTCSCLSLQWRGGRGPLSYLAWWNTLQCAKRGQTCEF